MNLRGFSKRLPRKPSVYAPSVSRFARCHNDRDFSGAAQRRKVSAGGISRALSGVVLRLRLCFLGYSGCGPPISPGGTAPTAAPICSTLSSLSRGFPTGTQILNVSGWCPVDLAIPQAARNQSRPTSLVGRTATTPRVAVKIFVKPGEPAPVRIVGEDFDFPLPGRAAGRVGQKQ